MSLIVAAAMTGVLAAQAGPRSVEQMEAELEAQRQIIELQRQRIETLEAQLDGRKIAPPARAETKPAILAEDPEQERALERALQRRGAAVLPPGVVEIAPGLAWSRSGRDVLSDVDNVAVAGLDARAGLASGWMVGANLPFVYRDIDGFGDNAGIGDLSVAVWKSIQSETGGRPSIVGSLRYSLPTGEDVGDADSPLGSGFHRLTGRLVLVRTFDPIALYGDLNYTAHLSENISGLDVERSGVWGAGAGANLAVTPEISASAGFDFSYEDAARIGGVEIGGNRVIGTLELGLGILLNRTSFLNLVGAVGVTDDSPDLTLGASLPVRF